MFAASSNAITVIAIAVVLIVAVVGLFLLVSRRDNVGTLSRETKQRDKAAEKAADAAGTEVIPTEGDASGADARARAAGVVEAASGGGVAVRDAGEVAPWEPIDEEEIGLNRRQFFNRGIFIMVALGGIAPFGVASLAFLWPSASGGFGGKINAGRTDDIQSTITDKKQPFYVPSARAYIQTYPAVSLPKAQKAYSPIIYKGMQEGFTALFQRCVHLGCRVPWCQSSQWFECPCHGSKYNAVGEKMGGPAPRGLDHFAIEVGDTITIDTGSTISGVPIGTDTTGQQPEGPHCV